MKTPNESRESELAEGNEPAYPIVASTGDPRDGVYCRNGLTKREHLAGLAMQGICAHPDQGNRTEESIAQLAVKQADALIAALAKEGKV